MDINSLLPLLMKGQNTDMSGMVSQLFPNFQKYAEFLKPQQTTPASASIKKETADSSFQCSYIGDSISKYPKV